MAAGCPSDLDPVALITISGSGVYGIDGMRDRANDLKNGEILLLRIVGSAIWDPMLI